MSKIWFFQLTRCTSLTLIEKGIRVNSVNPALIVTDLFENSAKMDEAGMESIWKVAKDYQPIGRAGRPEEVAKAVTFLTSNDASFIVGHHLAVDGGTMAKLPVALKFQ